MGTRGMVGAGAPVAALLAVAIAGSATVARAQDSIRTMDDWVRLAELAKQAALEGRGPGPTPGSGKDPLPSQPEPDYGDASLRPLGTVPVPPVIDSDIVNQEAAIALGKALFWDVQAGSDGEVACATCHFHAGVDNRIKNTVHPGPNGLFEVSEPGGEFTDGDGLIGSISSFLLSGAPPVPDAELDDRVGSQGVVAGIYRGTRTRDPVDQCTPVLDQAPFLAERQITDRNTPTVIGAAFNRMQFWDGRANDRFNGADPFGDTENAGKPLGALVGHSSLASQSVGPPVNTTEMACTGRPFNGKNSLASKLLGAMPLAKQLVSPNDGVLGKYSAWPRPGLSCGKGACTYRSWILVAFGSRAAPTAESQFSRYWGQAIQAYERTLIPDQTRFDRFLAGDATAMTADEQAGMGIFTGRGGCTLCHAGPELTDATVAAVQRNGGIPIFLITGADLGFHNVGSTAPFIDPPPIVIPGLPPIAFPPPNVIPVTFDPGRGGTGPNGVPHSVTGSPFDLGGFKTPALRNVGLTAPYFHNGGKKNLAEVVDHYNRGGDFTPSGIAPLGLSDQQKAQLELFLGRALTDCRVLREAAPFDHPSLVVPNGPSLPAMGAAGDPSKACP